MDRQSFKAGERLAYEPDPAVRPFYFHHSDLTRNPDPAKTIEQPELINLWNSIHFQEGTVLVHLHHPRYREDLLVQANPAPCGSQTLTCQWPADSLRFTEDANILNIILTDGLSMFLVPTRFKDIQKDSFTIEIPEQAYILGRRQARHYGCRGIDAELLQNGFQAKGELTDFSALAFSVKVSPEATDSFRCYDAGCPATINLSRDGQMVFTASCGLIRQSSGQGAREMVFTPAANPIGRMLAKKFRTPRVSVTPLPNITFEHPLTRKNVQMDLTNLSSAGFAVSLAPDEDVLLTRMILPQVSINIGGSLKIPCRAQVINRHVEKSKHIRYGFVILDMDIVTYNRLSHIVLNTVDPGIHIADTIDADRVWDLFFESGFLYARKYEMVQTYRKPLQYTYSRLYRDNPAIFSQVTYQRNGKIYGHVSMVRSYDRTWMVQHLAARALEDMRTGMQIIRQVIRYFDSLYCLPAVGMDYMMFYFRPENRFPDRFFGDFARHIMNPRICSLDLFAYLNYPTAAPAEELPAGWTLGRCSETDVEELNRYYRFASGGLLMDVLRLGKERPEGKTLSDLYASCGFVRRYRSLSLSQDGKLKAVLIANQSDAGLSLSDFLNGIKILATDAEGLPWPVLQAAVSRLTGDYTIDQIPLLVYPANYFQVQNVPCEKRYNLWIMDLDHGREYVDYRYGKHKVNA